MKKDIQYSIIFQSVFVTLLFVGTLWLITGVEELLKLDLGFLGILPRSVEGTIGIFTGPLVHGSMSHLYSNSLPLALLCFGLFYLHSKVSLEVFAIIYVCSGLFVWIAARDAYHIGSSGIVYGLVSFLLFIGLLAREPRSIVVALVVIIFYGGMFYGLVPSDGDLSWESHLFGALTGVFCAFYYFYKKRMPVRLKTKPALIPTANRRLANPYSAEKMTHTHPKAAEVSYFYTEDKSKE
ncbi:MAG: rhomboid family intramembrane serine protease [Cytophagales bacterium]|nr:rhomboid family intramembrane serine protease [Cytophagales bacterium]